MAEEQIIVHRNEDQRKDSIEIGTAGKGGALKVYFDALADRAERTLNATKDQAELLKRRPIRGGRWA